MPYQTIGWKKNCNSSNKNFHQSNSYHSIQNNNDNIPSKQNDSVTTTNDSLTTSKSIGNLSDGSIMENAELIEKLFPKCRPKTKAQQLISEKSKPDNDTLCSTKQPFDHHDEIMIKESSNTNGAVKMINHKSNHHNVESKRIWNFMGISPSPSPPPLSPVEASFDGENRFKPINNHDCRLNKEQPSNHLDSPPSPIDSRCTKNHPSKQTRSSHDSIAKFRLDNLLLSPDPKESHNDTSKMNKTLKKGSLNSSLDYDLNEEDDILFSRTNVESTLSSRKNEKQLSSIEDDIHHDLEEGSNNDESKLSESFKDEDYDFDDILMSRNHHLAVAGGKELFSSSRSARSKKRYNNQQIKGNQISKNKYKNNLSVANPTTFIHSMDILEHSASKLNEPKITNTSRPPSSGTHHRKQTINPVGQQQISNKIQDADSVENNLIFRNDTFAKSGSGGADEEENQKIVEPGHKNQFSSQNQSQKMASKDAENLVSRDIINDSSTNDNDTETCATIELINHPTKNASNLIEHESITTIVQEPLISQLSQSNEHEKFDSACERFATDLKNKLSIVSKTNDEKTAESFMVGKEEIDLGSESDNSMHSGSNFSKKSFDEPIARLIGSVPIAQYEGSPKRYGPKPGYPHRIVTTATSHYETVSPPKEPSDALMKSITFSSENGSPNSSSTSATFSSTDVNSSSSSCLSNRTKPLPDQWRAKSKITDSQLKQDEKFSHTQISCDEVVKSILNIPQLVDSETDDRTGNLNNNDDSSKETPLTKQFTVRDSVKKSPSSNFILQPKNESSLLCNNYSFDGEVGMFPRVGGGEDQTDKSLSQSISSLKSQTYGGQRDFDSLGAMHEKFKYDNERSQQQQPQQQYVPKPIRLSNYSSKQTSQTASFESTDSNKSSSAAERYLPEKEYSGNRSQNVADSHYEQRNSLFIPKPMNPNAITTSNSTMDENSTATTNNDLLSEVELNNNKNRLSNYICLSPEIPPSKSESESLLALSAGFPNFVDCPTTLSNNNEARESCCYEKASSSLPGSDGGLMLNATMPVLEDGLSSGMPSSDEMEECWNDVDDDGDGEEECPDNELVSCLPRDHHSIDDYDCQSNTINHGRTVIGCESSMLPSSSQNNNNNNNSSESGAAANSSYDYYSRSMNRINGSSAGGGGGHYYGGVKESSNQSYHQHQIHNNNRHNQIIDENSRSLDTHDKYCISRFVDEPVSRSSLSPRPREYSVSLMSLFRSSSMINQHQSSLRTTTGNAGGNSSKPIGPGSAMTMEPLLPSNNQYSHSSSYHHYYHHHHPSLSSSSSTHHQQNPQQQQQNYPNLSNSPTPMLSPNSPAQPPPPPPPLHGSTANSVAHMNHHVSSSTSSSSSSSTSSTHQPINQQNHYHHKSNQLTTPQQQQSQEMPQTGPNSSNSSNANTAPNVRDPHHHEEDCDTDQETDRLLGAQRNNNNSNTINNNGDERGFYDEKTPNKRSNTSREAILRWEPKVLIEGVLFRARYLGSTQLVCDGQPTKATRMMQAEEAVSRIKAPEGESQPSTEVDLFISTEKIMVLNTDLKEIMMDHALRTISYIADIGDLLVLMARRRSQIDEQNDTSIKRTPKMICHVFESEEAQYIAQSIGQAFQVAYMEFLKANGIKDSSFLKEMDYQEVLNSQEIFGDELEMFSKREKQKEVIVPKQKGEILGIVIVESGWGSMLPTVVIANLAQNSPSARCGQLNIGDQIIAINGISLVGLPLSTCQNYVKNTKNQTAVKFTIVPCPPVVEVKIKRPDTKYQLGFSVQNGVICSLLRGGIAERGGVRVGHRIIEINGQSVVAVPHDRIVNLLATSVGEIHMKTMPTSMFRLLTGQEAPSYM